MNPLPLVPTPAVKVSAMLAFTTGLQDLFQNKVHWTKKK